MATVIVEVMPKPEILDPQGKAITQALTRLGYEGLSVRQGKRFEIEVDGELTDERFDEIIEAAGQLLANTVIEDFEVYALVAEDCVCEDGETDGCCGGKVETVLETEESGCGCGCAEVTESVTEPVAEELSEESGCGCGNGEGECQKSAEDTDESECAEDGCCKQEGSEKEGCGCGNGGCCSDEDEEVNFIALEQVVVPTEYGDVSPTEVTMEIPVVQVDETGERA